METPSLQVRWTTARQGAFWPERPRPRPGSAPRMRRENRAPRCFLILLIPRASSHPAPDRRCRARKSASSAGGRAPSSRSPPETAHAGSAVPAPGPQGRHPSLDARLSRTTSTPPRSPELAGKPRNPQWRSTSPMDRPIIRAALDPVALGAPSPPNDPQHSKTQPASPPIRSHQLRSSEPPRKTHIDRFFEVSTPRSSDAVGPGCVPTAASHRRHGGLSRKAKDVRCFDVA